MVISSGNIFYDSYGIGAVISGIPLVIMANAISTGTLDLFLSNTITENSGSLYTYGYDTSYKANTLYVRGIYTHNSGLDLFVHGNSAPIYSDLSLYLNNFSDSSGYLDLYTYGYANATGLVSLYIDAIGTSNSGTSLYTYGKDNSSGNISLYIDGFSGINNYIPLYIGGYAPSVGGYLPLYTVCSGSYNYSTLYLHGEGYLGTVISNQIPLYIGDSGSTQTYNQTPLYLCVMTNETNSYLNLYLDQSYQTTYNSVDLVLPSGSDITYNKTRLYTHGY